MNYEEFLNKVLIITVIYNVKWYESNIVKSLQSTGSKIGIDLEIAVFDNGPEFLDDSIVLPYVKMSYVRNQHNYGVSESYNKGSQIAIERHKKWILLADYDFVIDDILLKSYFDSIVSYPDANLFAPKLLSNKKIISPSRKLFHKSIIIKEANKGELILKDKLVLNSGMLVSIDAFKKVGGYNENIPLDFSDEYFIRQFSKYYSKSILIDYECQHKLSSFEKQSKSQMVKRFPFYCIGSYQMSKFFRDGFWFYIWALFRALKLTLSYRTITFLQIYFRYHIRHLELRLTDR